MARTFLISIVAFLSFFGPAQAATVSGVGAFNLVFGDGPFDPTTTITADLGSSEIGSGIELTQSGGVSFDFFDGGASLVFNNWALDLPFNGYIFEFTGLGASITDVTIASTDIAKFSVANLVFDATRLAVDLGTGLVPGDAAGTYVGTVVLSIDGFIVPGSNDDPGVGGGDAPAVIPLPATLLLLIASLGSLAAFSRFRAKGPTMSC
jgi:hypothetical protein